MDDHHDETITVNVGEIANTITVLASLIINALIREKLIPRETIDRDLEILPTVIAGLNPDAKLDPDGFMLSVLDAVRGVCAGDGRGPKPWKPMIIDGGKRGR